MEKEEERGNGAKGTASIEGLAKFREEIHKQGKVALAPSEASKGNHNISLNHERIKYHII